MSPVPPPPDVRPGERNAGRVVRDVREIAAAAIAIALSSGAILGEYVAQPIRREAQRLDTRLAGLRMVGPHRAGGVRLRRRRRPRGSTPSGG